MTHNEGYFDHPDATASYSIIIVHAVKKTVTSSSANTAAKCQG